MIAADDGFFSKETANFVFEKLAVTLQLSQKRGLWYLFEKISVRNIRNVLQRGLLSKFGAKFMPHKEGRKVEVGMKKSCFGKLLIV